MIYFYFYFFSFSFYIPQRTTHIETIEDAVTFMEILKNRDFARLSGGLSA